MPSTMTHNYFALDVYERLNHDIRDKLKNNLEDLKTFAEGPDLFFFYNKMIGKKSSNIRNFGSFIHRNNTRDFFINTITYIKENNLENNSQILAFLYGFVCHYILDSTTHPFVFYKTGIFDKNKKETLKYNGLHHEMEFYIDIYMIYQKEKITPKTFKFYKEIANTKKINNELKQLLDSVFKLTFNKKNVSKILIKSIRDMKSFFHLFVYDRLGFKKKFYQFVDFLTPKKTIRVTPLSFNVAPKMKVHYLNLEKEEWYHPMDNLEISNLSFIELYRIGIDKAVAMIEKIDKILTENKNLKLLEDIFLNTSYITGKDCNDKRPMKFFEF